MQEKTRRAAGALGKAVLYGGAAALAGGARVHLSISHDGGMALAFAVLETREAEP